MVLRCSRLVQCRGLKSISSGSQKRSQMSDVPLFQNERDIVGETADSLLFFFTFKDGGSVSVGACLSIARSTCRRRVGRVSRIRLWTMRRLCRWIASLALCCRRKGLRCLRSMCSDHRVKMLRVRALCCLLTDGSLRKKSSSCVRPPW